MPAYLLACLLFIPTFVAYGFPSPVTIILNLLLLHGWFPNHSFNYASWSLTAELFFYLLFPFILPNLRNKSLITLSLLVTFGWTAYYLLVQFILPKFNFFLPSIRYLFHFLLGIVAGILVQPMLAYPGKHFLAAQKWMIVLVIMLIFLVLIGIYKFDFNIDNDAVITLLFALLIVALAFDRSFLSKALCWSPLILLGEISYAFYILQFPVYYCFSYVNGWIRAYSANPVFQQNTASNFWFFVSCLLAVSWTCYRFIELPIKQRAHSYLRKTPVPSDKKMVTLE